MFKRGSRSRIDDNFSYNENDYWKKGWLRQKIFDDDKVWVFEVFNPVSNLWNHQLMKNEKTIAKEEKEDFGEKKKKNHTNQE